MIVFVIILLILFLVWFFFLRKNKTISSLGTITLCTGAVKTGKSTLAVYLALRSYKKVLFSWRIASFFKKDLEKPLLYSNIPLKCEYVPVTTDMLLRKVRIAYKSVVLLDEASLVADSQLIHNNKINRQLLKFFKLFGHYSHGGTLILDTQSISDLHHAIKRCLNTYIYIYHTYKFIPFFVCMKVLEQRYADDGTIVSSQTDDVELNLKRMIIPKSVWRKFDTYCYSCLTDKKPRYITTIDKKYSTELKQNNIPSFRDWSDEEEPEDEKK